jgi:hypothetical protein
VGKKREARGREKGDAKGRKRNGVGEERKKMVRREEGEVGG